MGTVVLPEDEIVRRNIAKFREEAGLSLDKASAALGISRDGLNKIERGDRGLPRPSLMRRMVELYGRPMEHFHLQDPPAMGASKVPYLVPFAVIDVPPDILEAAREALEPLNQKLRRRPPPMPVKPATPGKIRSRGSSGSSDDDT